MASDADGPLAAGLPVAVAVVHGLPLLHVAIIAACSRGSCKYVDPSRANAALGVILSE